MFILSIDIILGTVYNNLNNKRNSKINRKAVEIMAIEKLENKIKENRTAFIKSLKDAGYVCRVVNRYAFNDSELLRLAVEIYNDLWGTFDKEAFEKAIA